MLQVNRSPKRLISLGRFFLSAPIVCLLHFRSHRLCSSGSVTQWVYFSWGNHTLHFILLAPTIFFTILAGGETAILKATGQLRALAMQASFLAILLLLVSVPVYWIFGERGILPVLFILAFMQWALNFRYSRRVVRWGVNMRKMTLVAGFPLLRLGGAFVLSGLMNSGCEFLIRAFLNQQGDLEVVGLFNAGITIVFVYAGMVFSVMDQDFIPVSLAFRVPEKRGVC